MAQTTTIAVRIPVPVKNRLEELSLSTERSKAYLAARAIEEYLDNNEWQVKQINEAVIEADSTKAVFIEHIDVLKQMGKKAKDYENKMAKKVRK